MFRHERYYEPEDDDSADLEEYVADWIEFESRDRKLGRLHRRRKRANHGLSVRPW